MKKYGASLVLVLSFSMLAAGGCAKQELVKKDESIAQPIATTHIKKEALKEQPIKQPSISQAQIKESAVQDASKSGVSAGQLQARLEKVYFDFDAYNLSEAARDTLMKNVELLRKSSAAKVRIEGNCDERGSDEYNLALGEKRAKEAMQYMVTMGITANRLSTISYGKEKPADPGHNEAAWAKNRRDEFVVQ